MVKQAKRAATGPLKELGPISHSIERTFYYMHRASLAQRWIGTERVTSISDFKEGETSNEKSEDREQRLKKVTSRSQRVEQYMLCWFCFEVLLLLAGLVVGKFGDSHRSVVGIASGLSVLCFIAVPAYRVFEIVETVININLFDPVRNGVANHVASVPRMVILGMWNWFEVAICFAIFYGSSWAHFVYGNAESATSGHGLYFSVVTQLTIGYGDVSPIHATQFAAALQGLIGFLLGMIMLSRIVAFLPGFVAVTQPATAANADPKPLAVASTATATSTVDVVEKA
ncbi:potassium channel family protein [Paraburkholderia sp. J11-2]|uniref:potassium channel family protein n=1 Tax=Paraburkholderia sp. J11-2 TaxID=2805431 RepID=UPI002AB68B0D|nr:potassium channel family protein [Paraburkholderia sp. J11-2]